ncbi:MAG TPA: DUF4058 family protein [Gemmataceae bacterium]|nr:DUF4058 family protein [Gemmataceae bacterium]
MPVHDWTRVDAGIFHVLHVAWIPEIWKVLNGGLLPTGYYALPEQHAGKSIADVLTLHRSEPLNEWPPPLPPDTGGIAVADAPPRVRRRETVQESLLARKRTLAIRHISGNRLVAMLEILSPSNKDRGEHVEQFANKAVAALEAGVHLLLVDLLPPGPNDPQGIHAVIRQKLGLTDEPYELPSAEPLTLVAYAVGPKIEAFVEHIAVGAILPEMPLFLRPDRYINVPLEATYMAAFAPMPQFLRDVLEGQAA